MNLHKNCITSLDSDQTSLIIAEICIEFCRQHPHICRVLLWKMCGSYCKIDRKSTKPVDFNWSFYFKKSTILIYSISAVCAHYYEFPSFDSVFNNLVVLIVEEMLIHSHFSLFRCTVKSEEDYRPMFENFVQDLLSTVNKPEWPSSELLLSLLGKILVRTKYESH